VLASGPARGTWKSAAVGSLCLAAAANPYTMVAVTLASIVTSGAVTGCRQQTPLVVVVVDKPGARRFHKSSRMQG
jgi:hypothetical protein